MLLNRKVNENAQCRYCKRASEHDGIYKCKLKGEVSASDSCRWYKFDPFAKRVHIKRNLDTSAFDPLDFEI